MMIENRFLFDDHGIRHCTLCPNHCPEHALSCGRGRRLFGVPDDRPHGGHAGGPRGPHDDHDPHHGHHPHGEW